MTLWNFLTGLKSKEKMFNTIEIWNMVLPVTKEAPADLFCNFDSFDFEICICKGEKNSLLALSLFKKKHFWYTLLLTLLKRKGYFFSAYLKWWILAWRLLGKYVMTYYLICTFPNLTSWKYMAMIILSIAHSFK